jgi:hypothetical protein
VHSYVVSGFLIQLFDYCHVLNFYVRFDSELVYSTMNLCEGLKDIEQKWSMSRQPVVAPHWPAPAGIGEATMSVAKLG